MGLLAAVSAVLLSRHKINSAWLVLGGALAGILKPAQDGLHSDRDNWEGLR
jgi:hypothetical protein